MSDLAVWLEKLALGKYADVFAENAIDLDVVDQLSESDLKELGIPLGDRKRFLNGVVALQTEPTSKSASDEPDESPHVNPEENSEAERRQLTVMFVDLVGSTALSSQLDPEDLSEVMRSYQNTVAGEINRLEGFVAKFMGDGVLAYFGWPQAHEDEPERAVRAGLAIAAGVGRLKAPNKQPLTARVGIATGSVVVGDILGEGSAQERTVVGETPNVAARLEALAKPGSVLVSDSTRKLCGEVFEFKSLGTPALKGVAEPVEVFHVIQERMLESRFQAQQQGASLPLMGRDQELLQLTERWQLANSREGQMVLLSGEAGIGKSRILSELHEALAGQEHHSINYQCSPYHHDSALYPVIQQLIRAAGFSGNDTNEHKLDKLEVLFKSVSAQVDSTISLIAALLGLDKEAQARYGNLDLSPQEQRSQTLQALLENLLGLAQQQPVLLVLEDAHWIDPTTLELLEKVLDTIIDARVFLLITARPTFEHSFAAHPIATTIMLNRLGRTPSLAIIERISKGKSLPTELVQEIIRKTDGVPLFVEELTKTVLESKDLRETDDAYLLDGPLGDIEVPSSLHDSLMARLDRLNSIREIAQTAACIGRDFSYGMLASVTQTDDDKLQSALEQLTDAELVFQRGNPPDAHYTFKHALVRDAAYNSLLKRRRQALHQRVGDSLLAEYPTIVETEPELLAVHYTAAQSYICAVDYWLAAGLLSVNRFAHEEAVGHLEHGLALVEHLGDGDDRFTQEHTLLMTLVQSDRTLGRYHEALAALERAEKPATAKQDLHRLAEINYLRGNIHFPLGNVKACQAAHQATLTFAEEAGSLEYQIRSYSGLGDSYYLSGEVIEAYRCLDRCVLLAQEHGYDEIEASNLHMRGFCQYFQNRVSACIDDCLRSIDLAGQYGHHRAGVVAKITVMVALWETGDMARTIKYATAAKEAAKLTGTRTFDPFARMYIARGLAESGDAVQALILAREASSDALEIVRTFIGPWTLGNLAYITDDPEERDEALAQAQEIVLSNCVPHCIWWFHRDAMDACLKSQLWERVEHYADALEEHTKNAPLPWCDYFIARGRLLASWGRGVRSEDIHQQLMQLKDKSTQYGFEMSKRLIDQALLHW